MQQSKNSNCPRANNNNSSGCGGCPIKQKQEEDGFNPLNAMPPPNQLPSPGQPFPLSTDREKSTIPKAIVNDGEKLETWEYPSAQMFWNAMLRKGWRWKEDQIGQKDMDDIIRIHNANNESAWEEVLKWERTFHQECSVPKLKSFHGDAKNLSPRARFRSMLGYELPFDRHNWLVDRCGHDVTYIIDYYDVGKVNPDTKLFAHLDVRPAIRDWSSLKDRFIVGFWRMRENFMQLWSSRGQTDENK